MDFTSRRLTGCCHGSHSGRAVVIRRTPVSGEGGNRLGVRYRGAADFAVEHPHDLAHGWPGGRVWMRAEEADVEQCDDFVGRQSAPGQPGVDGVHHLSSAVEIPHPVHKNDFLRRERSLDGPPPARHLQSQCAKAEHVRLVRGFAGDGDFRRKVSQRSCVLMSPNAHVQRRIQ